jgi:hypothetical protein
MIISATAQAAIRALWFNQTVKQSVDWPRLYNQFLPHNTQYEATFPSVNAGPNLPWAIWAIWPRAPRSFTCKGGPSGRLKGSPGGTKYRRIRKYFSPLVVIMSKFPPPAVKHLKFWQTSKKFRLYSSAGTPHKDMTQGLGERISSRRVKVERSPLQELIADLRDRGQNMTKLDEFVSFVQAIVVGDDGFLYANSDYRRQTATLPAGF